MGLDVYLHHCLDREAARAIDAAIDARTQAVWDEAGPYDDLTAAQNAAIKVKTDAIEEGRTYPTPDTRIDEPSKLYPEHLFRLGYFRSSYNDGGINSVMGRLGLATLYDILRDEDDSDEHEFVPHWDRALERADDAIAAYKTHLASPMGAFDVFEVSPFEAPNEVKSKQDALAIFKNHLGRYANDPERLGYMSREGHFYAKGLKVHALIYGISEYFKRPAVYVITEANSDNDVDANWYLQSLEIVKETIEYVLSKPDPENYYLFWSS